ncbi:acyltransferase [Paraburkholderia bryophila]|uniref:acyltransferase family protein n=1 Tax=Paraburkholderia bryophila TaxID=420952 RepID=UPI00234A9AF7|nr:acyltransferase [Paraburkholderia bryophila]WCM20559.1 acyltransferase [Paraburkholderia bryophila]
MKKIEEIEILRAIAILLTLMQHLGYLLFPSKELWVALNHNPPFWGGVDLFFSISGFVICRSLVNSWPSGSASAHWAETWRFWVRRFFRIVPTLWVWVCLFLIGAWKFNEAGGFGQLEANIGDAWAAVLNYSNVHIFRCVIGKDACGPNSVFWSLSLEEQFYLLLPLCLLLPRRVLEVAVAAFILIQLPIRRLPWEDSIGGALWFFRTDSMLLGASLAWLASTDFYARAGKKLEACRRFRAPVATVLVLGLLVVPKSGVPFAAGGLAILSCCLVFLASFNRSFLFGKSLLSKPLVWVGTRSFSLYLIHMPVMWFINELAFRLSAHPDAYRAPLPNNPFHPFLTVATFAGVFIVAECNYRWLETPLRRYGRHLTERAEVGQLRSPAPTR